jgi:hypothetical protein
MTLDGHMYRITDLKAFFEPIILGQGPPLAGASYEPWPELNVLVRYRAGIWFFVQQTENIHGLTAEDGSFSIPSPSFDLLTLASRPPGFVNADIYVSDHGSPRYRSAVINLSSEGGHSPLDIFLYPDTLDDSDGIAADAVSTALSSIGGLPGDTLISVSPNGLSFYASEDPATIKFTVALHPDTSPMLSDFIDLSLTSYDIHVDPSWIEAPFTPSAGDLLQALRSGILDAASTVNSTVLAKIKTVLEDEEKLPSQLVDSFLESTVSITFMRVRYPNEFTWRLDDKNDSRIAVVADPCIGYPRGFASGA